MKFFSLWEKVPVSADEGVMDKGSSLAVTGLSARNPLLTEGYSEVAKPRVSILTSHLRLILHIDLELQHP